MCSQAPGYLEGQVALQTRKMSTPSPRIAQPLTIHGTQVCLDDTPQELRQKLAQIALDEIFELVCVLSTEGIVLECSGALASAARFSQERVVGKPVWESFWRTASAKAKKQLQDAIGRAAGGIRVHCNADVEEGKNGGLRLDYSLRPVRDERDRIVFLILEGRQAATGDRALRLPRKSTVLVDVRGTLLLPTDTQEQYRQKLARIALDSMVHFVALLDASGTVLEINHRALDAAGLKLSQVEGTPFWTTFWWQVSDEVNAELRDAIRRAAQGESVRWNTETHTRASGETIVIDASLTPVRDENGKVVFITAEGRDISDRKAHKRGIAPAAEIFHSQPNASGNGHLPESPVATHVGTGAKRVLRGENGQPCRILLVDDDAEMCNYVRGLLSQNGYEVQAVADGAAALNTARASAADAILADVVSLHAEDFGFLRELRADPSLGHIPVILLSEQAGEAARVEGIRSGADDYLTKPFSERELLTRVESHLMVAGMKREAAQAVQLRTAQYETLLNHAPVGVYLVDADFRIQEMNPLAAPLFEAIPGGAVGRDFSEVIHLIRDSDYASRVVNIFRNTIQTGNTFLAPEWARYNPETGKTEYHEIRVDRILLPDGRFGAVCYFRDITPRKLAEQNANLLASIVESSDDAIVSKNLDTIIMSWNAGAERLFGYKAAEVIGKSVAILIPPDRQQEEPDILDRLKRGERVEHFETIRVRKDGSLVNVSLTISPVRDSSGKIVGASKVARDITDKVRQERALQELNAALQRANSDLQQFAWSASHDLQEPLRMVAIYSQLLQRNFGDKLGDTGNEYLNYTIRGARRMETLLADLRTYTHVSTVGEEPQVDIDAGAVLKKTLLNLEVAIRDSGASITSTALPPVRMFEYQLEQLFQNLIGNAIRYRSEPAPRIHISAVRRGADWLFSVQDNGIGIEPQFREKIFGIFQRLHTSEYSGTGMGLAICQRVIERIKGRIWVESEPDKGSTFYFTIPCTQESAAAANDTAAPN